MPNIGYAYFISNNEYYIITIRDLYSQRTHNTHDVITNNWDDDATNDKYIIKEYAEYYTDDYKIIDIEDEDNKILNLRFPLPKEMNYYLSKDIVHHIINNDIFFVNNNKLDKTYSGFQRLYYKNGILKSEFYHINGIKEGEYKTYYNTKLSITNPQYKQLYEKCNYVNGKIVGEHITYYESGQICNIYNYVDGKKNGKYICYYKNTNDTNNTYDTDDTDELKINVTGNFVNDEGDGLFIKYNKSGKIIDRYIYNKE
jgi:antitoxin component YwqK of YwqJK toxin-antitoxin module